MINHTLPLLTSSLILFVLSDVTMKLSDIYLVPIVVCIYMAVNAAWTLLTGMPVYGFLNWNLMNESTVLSIIAIPILSCLSYVANALLSQFVHGRYEWNSLNLVN